MKLNLVADYELPNGKRFVATFAIHESSNLVGLLNLCALSFPVSGGGFEHFAPKFLLMCESGRKAEAVAHEWENDYKAQGRLYDYEQLDALEVHKFKTESEG